MPFESIWFVILPEVEVPGDIIYHHFAEEETGTMMVSNLPNIAELVGDEDIMGWTHVV